MPRSCLVCGAGLNRKQLEACSDLHRNILARQRAEARRLAIIHAASTATDCYELTDVMGRPTINADGMGTLTLSRWAWMEVNGPIPKGLWVLHTCDNERCIALCHLYLGDHQQNTTDKLERGRSNRGERNSWARLSEADVLAIRRTTRVSQQAIADDYGITQSAVSYIKSGKRWRHLQ